MENGLSHFLVKKERVYFAIHVVYFVLYHNRWFKLKEEKKSSKLMWIVHIKWWKTDKINTHFLTRKLNNPLRNIWVPSGSRTTIDLTSGLPVL